MDACEITTGSGYKSEQNMRMCRKELTRKSMGGLDVGELVWRGSGLVGKVYRFTSSFMGNCADVEFVIGGQKQIISVPLLKLKKVVVLHLVLAYKWYDMIEAGEKVVEYRAMSDHWRKRLELGRLEAGGISRRSGKKRGRGYTHVRFARGYTARTQIFGIRKIDVGSCPYDGWDGDFFRILFGEPAPQADGDELGDRNKWDIKHLSGSWEIINKEIPL